MKHLRLILLCLLVLAALVVAVAPSPGNGSQRQPARAQMPPEQAEVNVLYGSGSSLTAAGDQLWHQNVLGVLGGSETGDVFGS